MKFYGLRHTYSSSVESRAIFNIRFGYTCFGLSRRQFSLKNPLRRIFPIFSLVIWNHAAQCGQHYIFRIYILGQMLSWRTRGDATPDLSTYYAAGFHFRLFVNDQEFSSLMLD